MTKAEKIQILVAQFTKMRLPRNEGETDNQYVVRTVQEKVAQFRKNLLENMIRQGLPPVVVDVSDL